MKFNLPTREECQAIVKNTEAFFCTETTVNGFEVELYDYRLAGYSDFKNNNAFELRGLTFVKDRRRDVWQRHILLNKFFNIDQTVDWMYDDVKDKKIVKVQDKLDGSVVSFVEFPDDTVRAKSKMSFTSDQAVMAQKLYDEDDGLQRMITHAIENNDTLIFELVSPDNQIVLEYQETKVVLLQSRNNSTGEYQTTDYLEWLGKTYNIEVAKTVKIDHVVNGFILPHLIGQKSIAQDIEGWIVTFEDGQMAKIKTDWYLALHGLIGPDAFRENLLIKTILDGNIDDVVSHLTPGVKKDKIVDLTEKVQHHFNHLVVEFKSLRNEYFNKYNENRKDFALKYSKTHTLFGAVMKTLNTSFRDVEATAEKAVKEHMLRHTKTLSDAQEYVKALGV